MHTYMHNVHVIIQTHTHILYAQRHACNVLCSTGLYHHHQSWASFLLWPSHFILSGAISPHFSSSTLDTYRPGRDHLLVSYFFAFSYRSRSKNTGVVCLSLLQWTTFCQNSSTTTHPSWVTLHDMAHSFTELHKPLRHDKAVIYEEDIHRHIDTQTYTQTYTYICIRDSRSYAFSNAQRSIQGMTETEKKSRRTSWRRWNQTKSLSEIHQTSEASFQRLAIHRHPWFTTVPL